MTRRKVIIDGAEYRKREDGLGNDRWYPVRGDVVDMRGQGHASLASLRRYLAED